MKITDYPKVTSFDNGDVILKDGVSGTKRVDVSDLTYMLFDNIPEMHNKIYRGKNLGKNITQTQWEAIETGTFKDLWIGDFWELGGVKWVITDFNYYLSYEGIDEKPHVVVTKKYPLSINTSYTPSGVDYEIDFYGSNLYNTLKGYVNTTYDRIFSNRLLSYNVFRPSSYENGYPNESRDVFGVKVSIPTQTQVFGHEFTRSLSGGHYNYQSQTGYQTQFSLYKLAFQETVVHYKNNMPEDISITLDSYGPNKSVVTFKVNGGYQSYHGRGGQQATDWYVIPVLVIG